VNEGKLSRQLETAYNCLGYMNSAIYPLNQSMQNIAMMDNLEPIREMEIEHSAQQFDTHYTYFTEDTENVDHHITVLRKHLNNQSSDQKPKMVESDWSWENLQFRDLTTGDIIKAVDALEIGFYGGLDTLNETLDDYGGALEEDNFGEYSPKDLKDFCTSLENY